MMDSKPFPPKFSVEAIKYASYIWNRVPQKYLDRFIPFESWSGHNPDVSHFRIFGSKSRARIPLEKRKDLETQSQKFLFVGYSYSKGCHIINLITKK